VASKRPRGYYPAVLLPVHDQHPFPPRRPALLGTGARQPGEDWPSDAVASRERGVAAARSKRILVVEDDLDSMHTLVTLLKFEGHQVQFAINGYAALDKAQRMRPDVVLLDIGLPGVSGLEICASLKRRPGLENVRVIALTAYATAEDRARSFAAGCEHHLSKPYDAKELLSLIAGK
jgi:CheY-like chemotaxis protein